MATFIKYIIKIIIAPFLKIIRTIKKQANINATLRKLAKPFIKYVQSAFSFKPKSFEDYMEIGNFLIVKKLVFILILVICSIPLVYFTRIAKPVMTINKMEEEIAPVKTFQYDDNLLKDYTGKAIIKAKNGKVVYIGDIEAGKCTGEGSVYDLEGNLVYKGALVKNIYTGEGELYSISGSLQYKGTFGNNTFNGEGIYYDLKSGDISKGTFKDGLLEGQGTVFNKAQQIVYEGGFGAGIYSGQGRLYVQGKLIYEGEFKAGRYEGKGKYYDKEDRLIYEGQFQQGKKHGEGILYNPVNKRVIYEGSFFEDHYQGSGTLYNGLGKEIYKGQFFGGTIDFTALLGSNLLEIQAMFKEDPIILYDSNGLCYAYKDLGVVIKGSADLEKAKEDFIKLKEQENNIGKPLDELGESVKIPQIGEDGTGGYLDETQDIQEDSQVTQEESNMTQIPQQEDPVNDGSQDPQIAHGDFKMQEVIDTLDLSKIKVEAITILKPLTIFFKEEEKIYEENTLLTLADRISIKILQIKTPDILEQIDLGLKKENDNLYSIEVNEPERAYKKVYMKEEIHYECIYDPTQKKNLYYSISLKKG